MITIAFTKAPGKQLMTCISAGRPSVTTAIERFRNLCFDCAGREKENSNTLIKVKIVRISRGESQDE